MRRVEEIIARGRCFERRLRRVGGGVDRGSEGWISPRARTSARVARTRRRGRRLTLTLFRFISPSQAKALARVSNIHKAGRVKAASA